MRIEIDPQSAEENGRLIAIRLSQFTLRLMTIWRRYVDDPDQAMILAAVTAVTADRLTRIELEPKYRDVKVALPQELKARCNVTSISEATGINRETARRKIERLLNEGFLARDKDGSITFADGLIQEERTRNLIKEQLETARRFVEEMFRDGVLRVG